MRAQSVVMPRLIALTLLIVAAMRVGAAEISFSGDLDDVQLNSMGSIYFSVAEGAAVSGVIDDVTANGEITVGGISTAFSCCIAAGNLELSNDVMVTAEFLDEISMLPGLPPLAIGDTIDLIDLEGDEATTGGGRIEVGLSFVLDVGAFDNEDASNYPFDPSDLLFTLFFIVEEGPTSPSMQENDIYYALGVVDDLTLPDSSVPPDDPVPAPLPPMLWLVGAGVMLLMASSQRKKTPRGAGRSWCLARGNA